MKIQRLFGILILFLFVLSAIAPAIPSSAPTVSAQSSSTSCPANQVFRLTLYPVADGLNALTSGARAAFQIQQLMFDSAFPLPFPNGTSDVAGSFATFTSNANYTTWYYHVRPGLTWSDGVAANASDIIATFGPKFSFNATYDFANLHTEVVSEYAANASTAVYVLNKPDALFPEKTSFLYFNPIYPASIVNTDGPSSALFNSPGLGPFYEANYTPGAFQMSLYRNPYYSPQPSICRIDINFVDSIALTSSYLEAGTTDLAPVEPSSVAQVLAANSHLRVFPGQNLIYTGLQWNISTYPFSELPFRQALAFGIDQGSIVNEAFDGFATPAYNAEGMIPTSNAQWYNSNQTQYSFNQTKSAALLQSIGITKGSDGFLQYPNSSNQPNGTDITLNLYTDVEQTWDTIGASVIQTNLQNMGFKVNEQTISQVSINAEFHSNVNNIATDGIMLYSTPGVFLSSPFLMTLPGWDSTWGPSFPPTNLAWESPASANTAYYNALNNYSATAVPAQQAIYVNQIQSINAQYLPMLTLSYDSYLWVGNTQNWQGFPSTTNGYFMMQGSYWNRTAWTSLTPVGASSTTSTTSSSNGGVTTSTNGGATTSTSSGQTAQSTTGQTTGTSASSTSTSSGMSTLDYAAIAVVVIIIIAAIGVMATRRKKPATTTT
ncbi:MAG: ABC transporter substrate-binding protein [Nitrososphaerales archaeon]